MQFFTVLFLLFSSVLFSQENGTQLAYPHSVVWNTPFEISLVTSNQYPAANKLELYIEAADRIELKKIVCNTYYRSSELKFSRDGSFYKTILDLKKDSLINDVMYQLVFTFIPENISSTIIKFKGTYSGKGNAQGYLFSRNSQAAGIEFYRPRRYAGKAMLLENAKALFMLKSESGSDAAKPVISDFWFKISEKDLSILKIRSGDEISADVFINSYGMLSVESELINTELHPYFISSSTWNHLAVSSDPERNSLNIYCNGKLVSSNQLAGNKLPGKITYLFGDENSRKYIIDHLRFSEAGGDDVSSIIINRNFTSLPDEIKVLRLFNFDNGTQTSPQDRITAKLENVRFVKSDAPLGLRSPDLNINILTSSFELEWSGGDYKQTQLYNLEKSENNKGFITVYSIDADGSQDAVYRFSDRRSENSDVLYYRVKALMKDGSSVYSSLVKVGQGLTEPFNMGQNFPNPFNPKTSIDIELFRDSEVRINVYDLEGKEVAKIFDGFLVKGKYNFLFDAGELSSGVYICRVSTPDFSQTTKMILTK